MKLTVIACGAAGLAFVVLALVFRSGMARFSEPFPRRQEVAKTVPSIEFLKLREGPSRQSLRDRSADLRRREGERTQFDALRGLEPEVAGGVVLPRVENEQGDPASEREEAPVAVGLASPESDPAMAEVDSYPIAYFPGREGGSESRGAPLVPVEGLVPLVTEIPEAMYEGIKTPLNLANLEPYEKKQAPLMVPPGLVNLATGKPVTASEEFPLIGSLGSITDGVKDAADGNYVELGPGRQWVQLDLGRETPLFGVWFWHFHKSPRAYIDVLVQIGNDESFAPGSFVTIYNADHDDTLGFGAGRDLAPMWTPIWGGSSMRRVSPLVLFGFTVTGTRRMK